MMVPDSASPSRYMIRFSFVLLLLILLLAGKGSDAAAQPPSGSDTIRLGGIVENGDTLAMVFLDEVEKLDRASSAVRPPNRRAVCRAASDSVYIFPFQLRTSESGTFPHSALIFSCTCCPAGDCRAAKRKRFSRSWRITNCTERLHRLQTPSKYKTGRSSASSFIVCVTGQLRCCRAEQQR